MENTSNSAQRKSWWRKLLQRKTKDANFLERAPRVSVHSLHEISFQTVFAGALKAGNISTTGIGLLLDEEAPGPSVGTHIQGDLSIADSIFPVLLEVRQRRGQILGCRFVGEDNRDLAQTIAKHLKREILAIELRPIQSSYLAPSPLGDVSWFTDSGQNELYFISDEKGIVEFHLTFLGQHLQGGRTRAMRFGVIVEASDRNKPFHKGSALIDFMHGIPTATLVDAETVLQNIPALQAIQLDKILELFKI
jgi:hypothetical protein